MRAGQPELVVLPPVRDIAGARRVPTDLLPRRPADERHRVDVGAATQALDVPREVTDEPGLVAERREHAVREPGVGASQRLDQALEPVAGTPRCRRRAGTRGRTERSRSPVFRAAASPRFSGWHTSRIATVGFSSIRVRTVSTESSVDPSSTTTISGCRPTHAAAERIGATDPVRVVVQRDHDRHVGRVADTRPRRRCNLLGGCVATTLAGAPRHEIEHLALLEQGSLQREPDPGAVVERRHDRHRAARPGLHMPAHSLHRPSRAHENAAPPNRARRSKADDRGGDPVSARARWRTGCRRATSTRPCPRSRAGGPRRSATRRDRPRECAVGASTISTPARSGVEYSLGSLRITTPFAMAGSARCHSKYPVASLR